TFAKVRNILRITSIFFVKILSSALVASLSKVDDYQFANHYFYFPIALIIVCEHQPSSKQ
ncbi:hypothetical protein, partial [Prevotella disiens]|uniref:hypothetical protein n=1 Tax=Prevotella disiens TaxID=28130 RepID=UPI001E4B29C8